MSDSDALNKRREFLKGLLMPRRDIVVYVEVRNGCIVGNSDTNAPLIDPETRFGLASDVSFKRKLRDMYDQFYGNNGSTEPGRRIYVRNGTPLNANHKEAYEALHIKLPDTKLVEEAAEEDDVPDEAPKKGKKKEKKEKERITAVQRLSLTEWMCRVYWDIRTFGAMMSTNVDCGRVVGPVQFGYGRSLDPILVQHHSLTRCAVTTEEDLSEGKETTFGEKTLVPYALYRFCGSVNPFYARKTGFSEEDFQDLVQMIIHSYSLTGSATRAEVSVVRLVIFEHDNPLGTRGAHEHRLHKSIKVERHFQDVPRSLEDYSISIDYDSLPAGLKVIDYDLANGAEPVVWTKAT